MITLKLEQRVYITYVGSGVVTARYEQELPCTYTLVPGTYQLKTYGARRVELYYEPTNTLVKMFRDEWEQLLLLINS